MIEYRYAEGKLEFLPELADELVRLKLDVIVTDTSMATQAAKNATKTIPVVFTTANDPVGDGQVASLARPGGNLTGLSILTPDLNGKRLELLKETVPNVIRIAFLGRIGTPLGEQRFKEAESAAKALGVRLQFLGAKGAEDLETAVDAAKRAGVQAILAASLARPGGNVTGLSSLTFELATKRLEILKDAVPKLARVGLLWPPGLGGGGIALDLQMKELRSAAVALKLKLEEIEAQPDAKGLESAFKTAKQKQVGAIMTISTRRFFAERKRIVELAVKYRLPAIYFQKEFGEEGGLMSYGADFDDLYRKAAHYVDKILKGTKPADLSVQQATKFEFVINLKAAKQIGLTIPNRVLERANQVIK